MNMTDEYKELMERYSNLPWTQTAANGWPRTTTSEYDPDWRTPPWQPTTTTTTTTPKMWPPLQMTPAEEKVVEAFIIELCSLTMGDEPPSKEQWAELQEVVQKMAAEYVLKRRERLQEEGVEHEKEEYPF